MKKADDVDQSGTQVIVRVAAVLEALAHLPAGMSLGQIATATDLPRSTVQRIVKGLETQGLVASGPGGVKLGPTITRLAASAHIDVAATAMPFIEAAGRRTRETVDLAVFRGTYALSVYQRPSDHELRVVSPVGTAFPVHCTAHGKALLADMPDDDVRRLLIGKLDVRTPQTKRGVPEIMVELAEIRQTGFAFDLEEHALGVCGLGVTIKASSAERYAVSIAVPTLRFDAALTVLKSAILRCKAEIEEAIGA